jgi:predicted DNA-binding transcriptional regulator YafY
MKAYYIQNAGHGKRLQAHCHRRDAVRPFRFSDVQPYNPLTERIL